MRREMMQSCFETLYLFDTINFNYLTKGQNQSRKRAKFNCFIKQPKVFSLPFYKKNYSMVDGLVEKADPNVQSGD